MGYMVNLVVEGRLAVVVGGGEMASRKVEDLLAARANVTVVAPEPCAGIRALAWEKRIEGCWRPYRTSDLYGALLAVAATDDEAVNVQVSKDARSLGVLVNVVDRPALCTFTVPATLRRGDLTVAVATEGQSPALAGVIREELSEKYGPDYAGLVCLMGELRKQMIAAGWDGRRIRQAVADLYAGGILEAMPDRERLRRFVSTRLGGQFQI